MCIGGGRGGWEEQLGDFSQGDPANPFFDGDEWLRMLKNFQATPCHRWKPLFALTQSRFS